MNNRYLFEIVLLIQNEYMPFHNGANTFLEKYFESILQVNLCQKHLFLQQLTHNMTKDC